MKTDGNGQTQSKVVFEYIKSPQFRSVHADGAIGGLTPQGFIHIAFYNERLAIPRRMAHKINDDGTLGDEIPDETIKREGVIRDMDVDVIMSLSTAESVKTWLEGKIADLKARQAEVEERKKPKS